MKHKICYTVLAICLMGLASCATGDRTPPSDLGEVITATSGTPQSHEIGGRFATPLVTAVTKNGSPAGGVAVTFTAPTTGASGTFADTGTASTTATTDAGGSATSAVFSANKTAGAYTVMASASGTQTPAGFNLTNIIGGPAAIIAVSGTPQSSGISTTFAAPLVVKVVDSNQNPVTYAIVTFQGPATGASGVFADTGTNTTTAMTNASGVATSAAFTANASSGADTVTAMVGGVSTPATFNLTNLAGAPATIVAALGSTPQHTVISTAFAAPLVATVFDSLSNPVSGIAIAFSAPTSGASGTFSNGMTIETDITNASGMATSSTFSANAAPGGPYSVTATTGGVATSANFSLTNTLSFKTYVFYLSGQEFLNTGFYALAGSVQIDGNGNVLAGEQDYNDGAFGVTSPQPSGDTILPGTAALALDPATGQGTLTLTTNNTALGVSDGNGHGIETLGVQFANTNHALIVQFDGSATSSGSMDLQTLPATLSGGYAFTLAGVDPNFSAVTFGGVFTISGGTTLQNGLYDTNDAGAVIAVTLGSPLTGTLTAPDAFGRGTISSTINYTAVWGGSAPVTLNYYVVGPEALRLIDVDNQSNGSVNSSITSDSAIGSAFGQGANATGATNASLGSSVFGIIGNTLTQFAAAGMFTTTPSSASFSGFADDNELIIAGQFPGSAISGTYTIASNGYGSLTISPGILGSISSLGIYLTDPNLNLSDPNNTGSGVGGALIADMDTPLAGGAGVVIPQTSTLTANFTGPYVFGGQDYNFLTTAGEFDFVGQGTVTSGSLSGTGLVSDPFQTLVANTLNTGVTFTGAPLPDTSNQGRYTMSSNNTTPNPLEFTIGGTPSDFSMAIYQANGGLLLWLNEDFSSVFLGTLQQQGSLAGLPAARKGITQTGAKRQASGRR